MYAEGGHLTLSGTSAFAEDGTLHVGCLLSSLTSPLKMKHTAIRKKIDEFFTLGKDLKRVHSANGGPMQGQALGPNSQNGHVLGPY